jgi:hypothetical protein
VEEAPILRMMSIVHRRPPFPARSQCPSLVCGSGAACCQLGNPKAILILALGPRMRKPGYGRQVGTTRIRRSHSCGNVKINRLASGFVLIFRFCLPPNLCRRLRSPG